MNKIEKKRDKPSTPKTFLRGLQMIEALREAGPHGLKIPEIALSTGIQRSTVYRYLDALMMMDYVHTPNDTQTYVFNESRFLSNAPDTLLLDTLKASLRRISDITGNSSFLVRRDNADSLCVHRELGSYPVQVLAVDIGHKQPLGVGAAGLALLSYQRPMDIEDILNTNQEKLMRYGGMTRQQMERLILSTQERGWSAVGNAAVAGVLGVGVPVPHRSTHPIFAISVSSVLERMSLSRQREIVSVIQEEVAGLA